MTETAFLPQPTVLLFGFTDAARLQRIRAYLDRTGLRSVTLPPEDWHQPLGTLLGLPGFSRLRGPFPAGGSEEEMLVLFALREGMLGAFLRFFKEEGLAPVSLKAMVTPTNVRWTPHQLCAELRKERAWVEAQRKKPGPAADK